MTYLSDDLSGKFLQNFSGSTFTIETEKLNIEFTHDQIQRIVLKIPLVTYFQKITLIQPKEVHIYSIDRPVPNRDISLVPKERLKEIAERGKKETGIYIRPFYL